MISQPPKVVRPKDSKYSDEPIDLGVGIFRSQAQMKSEFHMYLLWTKYVVDFCWVAFSKKIEKQSSSLRNQTLRVKKTHVSLVLLTWHVWKLNNIWKPFTQIKDSEILTIQNGKPC